MTGAPAQAFSGEPGRKPAVLTGVENIMNTKFKRYTEALFLSQATIMFIFQLIVDLKKYDCYGTTMDVVAAPKIRDYASEVSH